MEYLFNNCNSLIYINLSSFNTTLTNSMYKMFSGCKSLESLELTNFNTSSVITMAYLFNDCSSLEELNLLNFDTSLVTNMNNMFSNCYNLISLNINNFNTSSVKTMEYMFSGCVNLTSIDTTTFDVSLVTQMGHMFENCSSLTSLNLTNYLGENIKNMDNMFSHSDNLVYINFDNLIDDNIKRMNNIFNGTPENMVICINETNAKKMYRQIMTTKGCSVVNCSENWIESRKEVKASDNKCVEYCSVGYKYFFNHKCFESCPEGTFSVDYVCKKNLTDDVECNIKYFFLGKCTLPLNSQEAKQKFIESITKGIMNYELFELLLSAKDEKKVHTIKNKNEIYQIYGISNKKRVPGTTYINLDECGNILKEKHNLNKNEELMVFKVEYNYPEFKIPIIEYQIFTENGLKKLNLNHCKDIKVPYYIPKVINNFREHIYNPENKYYSDKCFPFEIDGPADILLYDRKNEFNQNNMSLCESLCIYEGYINDNIKCECDIKLKFNSFLSTNSDKYNLIYRFEVKKTNSVNFWIIKCFFDHYFKASLLFNEINFFILGVLGIIIIGAIIFRVIEFKQFNKKIRILIQTAMLIKAENGELNEEDEISDKEEVEINGKKNEIIKNDNDNDNDDENKDEIINYQNQPSDKNQGTNKEIKEIYLKDYDEESSNKKLKDDILKVKGNQIIFNSDDKNSIINVEKPKINFVSRNENLRNSITIDKKSVLDKFNNGVNESRNELIINDKIKKEFLEKTDGELNNLDYDDAIKEDKRSFFQYYFSLLKTKHILLLPFRGSKYFNSRVMNICYLLFLIIFYLTINTMFVDHNTIHKIYISKGEFSFSDYKSKIILVTFLLYALQVLFSYLITIEGIVLRIKKSDNKKFFQRVNKVMNIITLKFFMTYSIIIIFLLFSWLYIGCFIAIFPKAKMHLIKIAIISFSISLIIPLVLYLLTSFIRKNSLKKLDREVLYKISQILQIL